LGSGGLAPHILNLALDGGKWSASHLCQFILWKKSTQYPLVGGWVGSRANLDVVVMRKFPASARNKPWSFSL